MTKEGKAEYSQTTKPQSAFVRRERQTSRELEKSAAAGPVSGRKLEALPYLEVDDFGLPTTKRAVPETETSSDEDGEYTSADDGEEEDEKDPENKTKVGGARHHHYKSQDGGEVVKLPVRSVAKSDNAASQNGKPGNPSDNAGYDKTHDSSVSDDCSRDQEVSALPARAAEDSLDSREPTSPASPKTPVRPASDAFTRTLESSPKSTRVSQWSHQVMTSRPTEPEKEEDDNEWQAMTAYGEYDVLDEEGRVVAKGDKEFEETVFSPQSVGGAASGYTRVQHDEDALSVTSMDDNTRYLFKEKGTGVVDEYEEARDPLAQMEATKEMLTEGQRIAYVGVARLAIAKMVQYLEDYPKTKASKKLTESAIDDMRLWGQVMMVRLYAHMDIESAEQVMIEQLAEHGVQPPDLAPALTQNSRVKNPMAPSAVSSPVPAREGDDVSLSTTLAEVSEEKPQEAIENEARKNPNLVEDRAHDGTGHYSRDNGPLSKPVQTLETLPATQEIDIDLRWTVLCDLFLVLTASSSYDSRSRVLLESVADALDVTWLDVCRFERRVTEALEMQEEAAKENWDESGHIEKRRKMALRRKYMMMGLATVSGGLIIGLSAGVAAPLIGAGLAAGFTSIGVAGTGSFLAGAGGIAIITSGSAISGGIIGARASHRRTGAVQTFEYRPLHNNKHVNLILTISGWMSSNVDDVRLPFSTVDPVMGDIYSLHWEPEMLKSVGGTIRILATEALTQGLQQVLAATFLTTLMAALSIPIILSKLAYLIDNPWNVSLARADAAGLILADSLMERNLGTRPITLVGFSLGARVILSCLKELASKGAYGLIQNVYLFGSPVVARRDEYLKVRSIISGRFVSGYATNDWILGYLFRATASGISRVAGLAKVDDVPGLENMDVTKIVNGHMAYRAAMPKLLRECGWEVISDEFTEIEDPDPENHEARQRELIREIEEAREDALAQPKKRRFGLFKRSKLAQKKAWEMYDEKSKEEPVETRPGIRDDRVLFDVDAIRAELQSEQMEVRQLESTLPPMILNLSGDYAPQSSEPTPAPVTAPQASQTRTVEQSEFPPLRTVRSHDGVSLDHRESGKHNSFADDATPVSPLPTLLITPKSNGLDHAQPSNGTDRSDNDPSREPLPASARWPDDKSSSRHSPKPDVGSLAPPAHRPPMKSSATMPELSSTTSNDIEHNAWAHPGEEDDDFGKETEVTMSFG